MVVVAELVEHEVRPAAARPWVEVVDGAHDHPPGLAPRDELAHEVHRLLAEEVDEVRRAGRPSGADQRHGRAGEHEHADRRLHARSQRHVVAAHAHHERVLRLDVLVHEQVLREHALASTVGEGGLLHGGVDARELAGQAATLQLPVHPVRHVRHLRLRRPQHLLVAGTERERSGVGSVTARVEEPVLVVEGRVADQPGDGAWPERGKQHLQVAHPVAVVLAVKLFSAQARRRQRLARARGELTVC
mmetsp:Transcript_23648/g.60188  ORF Transcript_23648/g.60188 Transcript_23648/m.60188 type:complete len:246 (-) Transcript_23648:62-799(-)